MNASNLRAVYRAPQPDPFCRPCVSPVCLDGYESTPLITECAPNRTSAQLSYVGGASRSVAGTLRGLQGGRRRMSSLRWVASSRIGEMLVSEATNTDVLVGQWRCIPDRQPRDWLGPVLGPQRVVVQHCCIATWRRRSRRCGPRRRRRSSRWFFEFSVVRAARWGDVRCVAWTEVDRAEGPAGNWVGESPIRILPADHHLVGTGPRVTPSVRSALGTLTEAHHL